MVRQYMRLGRRAKGELWESNQRRKFETRNPKSETTSKKVIIRKNDESTAPHSQIQSLRNRFEALFSQRLFYRSRHLLRQRLTARAAEMDVFCELNFCE